MYIFTFCSLLVLLFLWLWRALICLVVVFNFDTLKMEERFWAGF